MKSFDQVDNLYITEYLLLMKARALKRLDEEHLAHKQAWINQMVKSTKQQGSKTVPVYRSFDQFFDFEKLESELLGKVDPPKPQNELTLLLKKANS